jgi:hypothetical protein
MGGNGLLTLSETPETKFGVGCGEIGDVIFAENAIYIKIIAFGWVHCDLTT